MRSGEERGATVVIVALLMTVFFMAASFAVDIGVQAFNRQNLRNAMDSAALAGAGVLATSPGTAKAEAMALALKNAPDLTPADLEVSFRCLVGDRDGNGLYDPMDVPGSCNPGANGLAAFTCERGVCTAPCDPDEGDICNTVVTKGVHDVAFRFSVVGGIGGNSTGVIQSAACVGFCGNSPRAPIDVGLIIDRTGSMSSADLANAKNAARDTLGFFDPKYDHVALGVIHKSSTSNRCSTGAYGRSINGTEYNAGLGTWIAAPYPVGPLLSDYQLSDGSLNSSSAIVRAIDCMNHSGFSTGQGHTDIGGPILAMSTTLQTRGRVGVKKAIMILTDGEANLPTGTQPCGYAVTQGQAARAAGVDVYTIGFGIAGKRCGQDTSGAYRNATVTRVLADAASQPADDNGCTQAENDDGDAFYCEPKTADLSAVFIRVANKIVGSPHLVRIPG